MYYHVRFQGPHSNGPRRGGTVVRPEVSGSPEFSVFGSMPLQGVLMFLIGGILNVWVHVRTKGLTE